MRAGSLGELRPAQRVALDELLELLAELLSDAEREGWRYGGPRRDWTLTRASARAKRSRDRRRQRV